MQPPRDSKLPAFALLPSAVSGFSATCTTVLQANGPQHVPPIPLESRWWQSLAPPSRVLSVQQVLQLPCSTFPATSWRARTGLGQQPRISLSICPANRTPFDLTRCNQAMPPPDKISRVTSLSPPDGARVTSALRPINALEVPTAFVATLAFPERLAPNKLVSDILR